MERVPAGAGAIGGDGAGLRVAPAGEDAAVGFAGAGEVALLEEGAEEGGGEEGGADVLGHAAPSSIPSQAVNRAGSVASQEVGPSQGVEGHLRRDSIRGDARDRLSGELGGIGERQRSRGVDDSWRAALTVRRVRRERIGRASAALAREEAGVERDGDERRRHLGCGIRIRAATGEVRENRAPSRFGGRPILGAPRPRPRPGSRTGRE